MTADLAGDAARTLVGWEPRNDDERRTLASFRGFFEAGDGPMGRGAGRDHATASCVVLSSDLARTLLVFHGKGRFWVQPGGHIEEGDASIVEAGLRELREETGVSLGADSVRGLDLDHHALDAAFGACASHLDFGVIAIADPHTELVVSDESEDVRWFDVDALPEVVAGSLPRRVAAAVVRLGG
ncbi:NUDIX hydrolase [Microbacterium indicum]|uniref:NUDIX hydrolase n=1 Tax=Microbacterium indicum TaxID=358100 RepID=UPI000687DF55|nr:NUDIX domain-containing protein [Microbacterium indicum]